MSDHSALVFGYLWGIWSENRKIEKSEQREMQKQKALEDNDIRKYFKLIGIDVDSEKIEQQFEEYEGIDGMRERWGNCIKAKKMSSDKLYDQGYSPAFLNYIRKVTIKDLEGFLDEGDFLLGLYKTWRKNVDKYLLIQKQKIIEDKEKEAEERKEMQGRMSTPVVIFVLSTGLLLLIAIFNSNL